MRKYLFILFLLSKLFGQYDQIFVGSRPLSMGGAFTAVADDANAITWNAAGLLDFAELNSLPHTQNYMLWESINPI